MVFRLVRRWLFDQWDILQAESRAERAQDGDRWDWRPMVALVLCAVSLTLHEYYGNRGTFDRLFGRWSQYPYYDLLGFAWWSGTRAIGYGILPLASLIIMRERPIEYGLSLRNFIRHAWIYGALFAGVLPLVIGASYTTAFQHTYPFYRGVSRSGFDLVVWELLYALQFLTLEFFFRGYLLFMLRRALGAYAIFVMVVPYCMIHYPKPIAEVMGAIFAGIALGTLALRTRSIWFGVAIHTSVAWTMDFLSLLHTNGLPKHW